MALTDAQEKRFDKLVSYVTLRIDEYAEQIEGEVPDAPVGDIKYELTEAAKAILRLMRRYPALSAAKKQYKPVALDVSDRGGSVVPLADDFLRFVSVKMAGWMRPATEWVEDTSRIYQQQIYEQRRATKDKPVAAMVPFLDEFERFFERDAGTYQNADAKEQASAKIQFSGWTDMPSDGAEPVAIFIDGHTVYVGGFTSAVSLSGSQTAQIIRQMLNGEFVEGASGYKALPDGYTATSSSSTLTILRDTPGHNPIDISFAENFTEYIIVTGHSTGDPVPVTLNDGFSGAPIEGDLLKKGSDTVGEVLKVDTDKGIAILKLDQAYLSLSDVLTAESGKYEIKITELKTAKYTTVTEAKRAVEVFPAGSSVESLYYIPYLHPAEMPTEFEDALVYRATSAIFLTMREANIAGAIMEKSNMALQELNAGQYGGARGG